MVASRPVSHLLPRLAPHPCLRQLGYCPHLCPNRAPAVLESGYYLGFSRHGDWNQLGHEGMS